MKRFKKKKNLVYNKFLLIIIIIFFFFFFFLYYFSIYWSVGIVKISKLKVNEITTNIVNDAVFNYKSTKVNLKDLIVVSLNNKNEIISVDVEMEKAYNLLENIVYDIRENIKKFQYSDYNYYNMESLSYTKNGIVISIPMWAITGQNLIVNLGPKIPVKLSLLENVKGSIRTDVEDYGLNNSMLNVFLKLEIEQNIEMPSASDSFYNTYEMLIASKLIKGRVPNFIGGYKNGESEIVNIPVN